MLSYSFSKSVQHKRQNAISTTIICRDGEIIHIVEIHTSAIGIVSKYFCY